MITLIKSMGDDLTVVNAARVSFSKKSLEFCEADEKLIKYLAKHNHWTPFSHVMIQVHIKMPFFIVREWYRHNVGFSRNEVSRRYVQSDPEFFLPRFRMAPEKSIKQGSGNEANEEDNAEWGDALLDHNEDAASLYKAFLAQGMAPEQARLVLPMNAFTEFIETASLYAYARLYNLRKPGTNAQKEIQSYAVKIDEVCSTVAPHSWKALKGE